MTSQRQAALFHARERRRNASGSLELFGTHRFAIPTAAVAAASFPVAQRTAHLAFATRVVFASGSPAGIIFCLGNATTGLALYVDGQTMVLRAGGTGDAGVEAIWDYGAAFPDTLALEIYASINAGTGEARLWANGAEVARATSVDGAFAAGWAAAANGAFAAAAPGALPADVTETGAPADFEVTAPLTIYAGQLARQHS